MNYFDFILDKFYPKSKHLGNILSKIMGRKKNQDLRARALKVFKKHNGFLRTSEALKAQIHPRILYELREKGVIEQIQVGLYALKDLSHIDSPDFATIAKLMPEGVICLISALSYYNLTVQIPHFIYVAIKQNSKFPKINYPPVKIFKFSEKTYSPGIEIHKISGIKIKIYSREKTIIDCFKHRSKVGIEVAIEGLKNYWFSKKTDINLLLKFAKISRVEKIITPYLESIVHDQS